MIWFPTCLSVYKLLVKCEHFSIFRLTLKNKSVLYHITVFSTCRLVNNICVNAVFMICFLPVNKLTLFQWFFYLVDWFIMYMINRKVINTFCVWNLVSFTGNKLWSFFEKLVVSSVIIPQFHFFLWITGAVQFNK